LPSTKQGPVIGEFQTTAFYRYADIDMDGALSR